jgi:hypothetical protein
MVKINLISDQALLGTSFQSNENKKGTPKSHETFPLRFPLHGCRITPAGHFYSLIFIFLCVHGSRCWVSSTTTGVHPLASTSGLSFFADYQVLIAAGNSQ